MLTAQKLETFSTGLNRLARRPWSLAAITLLLLLFVTNIYRAATQSITHDEAVTWEWLPFSGTVSEFFDSPIGNHHPLNNLFSKILTSEFGLSEIAMRIPSLLGGLLYFYAVYRLSALLFGESFLFLLSVSLLSLNPFLLDYLSCARGYAGGLGFLFYAIYQAMLYLSEPWSQQNANRPARLLNKMGIALGLSVGFNVVMVFPCAAFATTFLAILIIDSVRTKPEPVVVAAGTGSKKSGKKKSRGKQYKAGQDPVGRSFWQALLHFAVPALVVSGVILSLPRRLVYFEEGYEGPPSLRAILDGIVRPSFLHSAQGKLGLASWFSPELAIRLVTDFVVPAGLVMLAIVAIQIFRTWVKCRSFDALPVLDRFLLLLCILLSAALLLIVASRYVLHAPYPEQRTVLYWVPLLGLMFVGLTKRLYESRRPLRLAAVPMAVLLVLCVAQFVTQFNTRYYAEWAYSAATKDMMALICARHAAAAQDNVRIGVTWQLEPGVNFYRAMWRLPWMEKASRQSPDGDYDYYMLLFGDVSLVDRLGLKVLMRDKLSGSVLAERRRR